LKVVAAAAVLGVSATEASGDLTSVLLSSVAPYTLESQVLPVALLYAVVNSVREAPPDSSTTADTAFRSVPAVLDSIEIIRPAAVVDPTVELSPVSLVAPITYSMLDDVPEFLVVESNTSVTDKLTAKPAPPESVCCEYTLMKPEPLPVRVANALEDAVPPSPYFNAQAFKITASI
jgi:hypothetical protein